MVRYTLFLLVVLGSAATAIAAASQVAEPDRNVTVIQKNQAFPALGPQVFTECKTEDCSEV